ALARAPRPAATAAAGDRREDQRPHRRGTGGPGMKEAAVAFSAGLLSFATPCVLPLVPAYLGAIGARSSDPRRALLAALPFVLGFSLVFIALGAGAGLAGGALTDHRAELIKLSGIL